MNKGRHKLTKTIEARMVNFWCRTANSSETTLSSQFDLQVPLGSLYEESISIPLLGLSNVKSILEEADMSYVLNLPNKAHQVHDTADLILSKTWLSNAIKLRLSNIYKQN